jgi:hypothetical protein
MGITSPSGPSEPKYSIAKSGRSEPKSWLQTVSPTITSPLRISGLMREAVPVIRSSRGLSFSAKSIVIIDAQVLPIPVAATTTRRPAMRPST